MDTQSNIPRHRHSIRLKGYEYTQPGAYFVTVVTHERQLLFGKITNSNVALSPVGKIVLREWISLPNRFPFVELDTFVIMPNHLHAILVFHDQLVTAAERKNASPADTFNPPSAPTSGSLGVVIGQFKSRVTKKLWQLPDFKGVPIWQRNYYEHIIRDETDYNNIILYIKANPVKWEEDKENPHGFD